MNVKGIMIAGLAAIAFGVLTPDCIAKTPAKRKTTSTAKRKTTAAAPAVVKGGVNTYGDYLTTQQYSIKKGSSSISIEYPTGGNEALVEALRTDIASKLAYDCNNNSAYLNLKNDPAALLKLAIKPYSRSCTPFGDGCETIESEYAITYHTDNVVTMNCSSYTYSGGAHGAAYASPGTYLVSTGEVLTDDMLPPIDRMREIIAKALTEDIGSSVTDWKNGDAGFFVSYNDLQYPSANPYVNSDGLNFLYGLYEIAPYAAGMPKATIPLSTAKNYLTGKAAEFLK